MSSTPASIRKVQQALYKLLGLAHVQVQSLHVICVSQLRLHQKALGLLHFPFAVKNNCASPTKPYVPDRCYDT